MNSKTSLIYKIDKAKIKVCKYAVHRNIMHGFITFPRIFLKYSTVFSVCQCFSGKNGSFFLFFRGDVPSAAPY